MGLQFGPVVPGQRDLRPVLQNQFAGQKGPDKFHVHHKAALGPEELVAVQLLKEGAILIAEGWDVLQEYTYLYPELPLRQKPIGPMTLSQQETKDNLVVAETPSNPEKTDTKAVDKLENRAYIDVQEILPHVSADEAEVLRQLESGKQPVDRMIDETQLPAGRVLSALTLLEVKGFVKRLPARYYELAKK